MATIQIVYESRYGQTEKIAEHIASMARHQGHSAHVSAVAGFDPRRLAMADAYVVLAPVFYGKYPPATRDFIARHRADLAKHPSAFVSVSGAAGSARPEDREGARQRALGLLATTSWTPSLVGSVGGAVAYPKYGIFTRLMMKMISKREGRPTDTSRSHELTDWSAVDRIARELLAMIEPRATASEVPLTV